jgi:hypothetical protein
VLRDVTSRNRLVETRLHGAELLAHERRAGGHGVAFTHRDLDDRLVRFRDQLQAIALQRAEDLTVVAIAAGAERAGSRQEKESSEFHA